MNPGGIALGTPEEEEEPVVEQAKRYERYDIRNRPTQTT